MWGVLSSRSAGRWCVVTPSMRGRGTGSSTASARVWTCSPAAAGGAAARRRGRVATAITCWPGCGPIAGRSWSWQLERDVPGLVGLLNLTASLTKAGVEYSSLWSVDFTDEWALDGLRTWLETGRLVHDVGHVHELPALDPAVDEVALGRRWPTSCARDKAIIGIFDEGCMGMYNAIFDDELLNPIGDLQGAAVAAPCGGDGSRVGDDEADAVRAWLDDAGRASTSAPTRRTS